jgi:hypothetical protein
LAAGLTALIPARTIDAYSYVISLKALLRDGDKWASPEDIAGRADLPTALGDVRRGAAAAEGLGYTYQSCVESLVASEALTIAARAVQRDEAAQTRALADAARHGRWVPLPAAQPAATNLSVTAATAVGAALEKPAAPSILWAGGAAKRPSSGRPQVGGAADHKRQQRTAQSRGPRRCTFGCTSNLRLGCQATPEQIAEVHRAWDARRRKLRADLLTAEKNRRQRYAASTTPEPRPVGLKL